MESKVYQGQSFIDKVLETTGSSENAFEMAVLNGFSLSDTVAIGQELKSSSVTRKGIVKIFSAENRPASAIRTISGAAIEEEGIGYMAIGNNFIVR